MSHEHYTTLFLSLILYTILKLDIINARSNLFFTLTMLLHSSVSWSCHAPKL